MRAVFAIVLLAACATSSARTTADSHSRADDHPAAQSNDAQQQVIVSGRLRAHDGSALRMGEVTLRRNGLATPTASVALDADGRFRIAAPPGVYMINIAAVDHASERRETLVREHLKVDGTLGTYKREEPDATIPIRADFLDRAGSVVAKGPEAAKRVDGLVYRIELPQRPDGAVRLRYQIGRNRTYNGPTADAYESDRGGDYWSIVELGQAGSIELDLGALPPAGVASKLTWRGEDPTTDELRGYLDRWYARIDAVRREMPLTDGKILAMTDAQREGLRALASEAAAEADAAKAERTRMLLRAAHIRLFFGFVDEPAKHGSELEWIVDHVPPGDPNLAMVVGLDHALVRDLRETNGELATRTVAWLERRAAENPEPGVAITALAVLLDRADRAHDDKRMRELYALTEDPRFTDTYYRDLLRHQYDPARPLQRGKPLRAFEFAALEGDVKISSSDREGKLYLLEFWATWCGPCVGEMPKLHEVYAAINDARPARPTKDGSLRKLAPVKRPKIEFVFVSFDATRSSVTSFRKQHWSMPWTHAFVGDRDEEAVMKEFGFSGVPTAILVDERGTILEVGEDLRGDRLLPTLQRVLAERNARSN